jgi:hypothetical protein
MWVVSKIALCFNVLSSSGVPVATTSYPTAWGENCLFQALVGDTTIRMHLNTIVCIESRRPESPLNDAYHASRGT